MNVHHVHCGHRQFGCFLALGVVFLTTAARGDAPRLETIYPAGAQAGQSVEVEITGAANQLYCSAPGIQADLVGTNRFRIRVPADTVPGLYDLWAVNDEGISAPRTFAIRHLPAQLEAEPNNEEAAAQQIALDTWTHGRLEQKGDQDYFEFAARQGQRIILECWAERIDSRLRAILEVFDASGRRLAVNRGYYGVDPLIDLRIPADGVYIVRVRDLVSSGGSDYYYQLEIDTGPRVAFAIPSVVQRNETSRITLFGWNLAATESAGESAGSDLLDQISVEIPASLASPAWSSGLPRHAPPAQAAVERWAYHLPGSHMPVALGVTDVPVAVEARDHAAPERAQGLEVPCEVSGQLIGGDECDWYALDVRLGEVLYIEAIAQRMHSPLDLAITLYAADGRQRLESWSDEVRNIGGDAMPSAHLDPSGRWVVPADGRYLIAVRNLTGGIEADSRRIYRLSVRREEPDYQLMVTPQNSGGGLTIPAGGTAALDVVALRTRGMYEAIEISAEELPAGITCQPLWLGPGVERGVLVVEAAADRQPVVAPLTVLGKAERAGQREARAVSIVRAGVPTGWSRLASQLPLAVAGSAEFRIHADTHRPVEHHLYGTLAPRHAPGGIVDVAVRIERKGDHRAPVKLIGIGLPPGIQNQTTLVPAEADEGYLSFYLPPHLDVGRYSLSIRAETELAPAGQNGTTRVVTSNPITFDVEPAAFLVEVDPYVPRRVKRGETFQINYGTQRQNGFIGKIHTELAAPGIVTDVPGLRARGETFVGQSDRGSLQITVNPDAPLGPQAFLRLFSVGVLEDEPLFQGACFLQLEIVE